VCFIEEARQVRRAIKTSRNLLPRATGHSPKGVLNNIYNLKLVRIDGALNQDGHLMIYKGVEFTVTAVAPGIWKWQFQIGDRVVAGKTEAKLNLLAVRRVQFRIDRELKKAAHEPSAAPGPSRTAAPND
jgi:hypothetical protein